MEKVIFIVLLAVIGFLLFGSVESDVERLRFSVEPSGSVQFSTPITVDPLNWSLDPPTELRNAIRDVVVPKGLKSREEQHQSIKTSIEEDGNRAARSQD